MLKELRSKSFANGIVYALQTEDGYPIEVTDTFLPNYTKDAINDNENTLKTYELGDRTNRWMIGVSCMSGCPIGCKFCLEENTNILMSDFTDKKIQNIKIGDKIVGNILRKKATKNSQDYATKFNKESIVTNIFTREYNDEIITIITEDGNQISVTKEHPIACKKAKNNIYRNPFILAKEIEIGDTLFIMNAPSINIENDIWLLGWLSGFAKGDGIISKNTKKNSYRLPITQSNLELILLCEKICNQFDISCSNITINKNKNPNYKTNYRLTLNQTGINKLNELIELHKNDTNYKKGFLAGFYDAEGYSFYNNKTTKFCNCNKKLLEYVNSLVEFFEFKGSIKLYNSNKNNTKQDCYILETNINRNIFSRLFNPRHPKSKFLKDGNIKIKGLKTTKVVEIKKEIKKIKVYNLETSTNTYFANNILVHNCATGKLKKYRNLTAEEIVEQVEFIINKNKDYKFEEAWEHKINYTRMGEPFLNLDEVKKAIEIIDKKYPNTHHYISTIGLQGSDFSWIKDNITLQISLHSLDEERRHNLIPVKKLMSIEELGQIRTNSNLKTTVNMTLVDFDDFDINILKQYFDPKYFFIKLSPINENEISESNNMGKGVIEKRNLL